MHEDQLDFRLLFGKVRRYWPLFLSFFCLTMAATWFYLRITQPVYQAEASFLIRSDEGSSPFNEEALFTDLGLVKKNNKLEDERLVLASSPVMRQVVETLEMQYQYVSSRGWRRWEMDKHQTPVQVVDWRPRGVPLWLELAVAVNEKGGFQLRLDDKVYSGEFGKDLHLPQGTLVLTRRGGVPVDDPVTILIWPESLRAKELVSQLEVELLGKEFSTLRLAFKDVSPRRAVEVLETLIELYNRKTIGDKNQVYENAIRIVDERIQLIGRELSAVESNVEAYKRQYSAMELGVEGNLLLNELATYNKELSGTGIQLEILNSIESFLNRNKDSFEFVPTNLSLNNLTLSNQLENFNELLREKGRLLGNLGPSHPDLVMIDRQIKNLRQTIIDNIASIKRDLLITRNANEGLKTSLESRLNSLPRRERDLLEIERRKGIKENLYLYLLQKREEAAISMAVTNPNGKIVEPPATSAPISPRRAQLWLIAAFLGLAVPLGFALLHDSFNDKVYAEEDVGKATEVPVTAVIGLSRGDDHLVVKENSHSMLAEMFRLLRVNLAFVAPGETLRTLLITSGASGEGKSFIALNLGMTMALAGKKVMILELDLRKPRQELYLNLPRTPVGLVNYLIDPELTSRDVIRNTGLQPNLDIISSGPKPPNPSELILSARLRQLVNELRQSYDFIILDAPPVGLVADALQLRELADATMYVVRAAVTRKGHLQVVDDIAGKNKLPRPFIVLNGVRPGAAGGYGKGYGYFNGNGYYREDGRRPSDTPAARPRKTGSRTGKAKLHNK